MLYILETQRRHLNHLMRNGAFRFTDDFFAYTSGKIGPYYINSAAVMNNGEAYSEAVESLSKLIEELVNVEEIDVISGGERRDWFFSSPVAANLSKPHLAITKNGNVMGARVSEKRVVHVSDLNNTGHSQSTTWIPTIRKLKGEIKDIFFYVDRDEGGSKKIRELGVRPHSLVTLDGNAWDFLAERGMINYELHMSIYDRMEDPEGWARLMLKSEKGLRRLAEIHKNPKSKYLAERVMNQGYPDLKDELIERLKHLER